MKILFDARYIRTDFHDGISRYTTELANAFAALTKVTFIISDLEQLHFLPAGTDYVKIHPSASPKEPFTARILNKYKPDVVYSPMQVMGATGRDFKLILTSHDMIYYRHPTPPRNLNPLLRAGWRLYHATYLPERIALNSADIVATVSQTVAREFEKTKLTKRPIVVIPNAPQTFDQFVTEAKSAKPKNIIYMGTFMPYKNVETLILGMKWLPGKTLHLLSKITPKRKGELEALIPKGRHVVFHNGVSDETYAKLLVDKGVLATASFDEGFGLPVAEALGLGVPAVVSDIAIFHEVAAGGALYFNPNRPKEFASRVLELDKKSTRDRVIAQGKQQANTFSWESSAQALLSVINSLV